MTNVPAGARILLDFIAQPESGGRYDVLFGHHERELGHPITTMTIDQLLTAQIGWGQKWKSSAAGRYQIMQTTLAGLKRSLGLTGAERFDPPMQDDLAYALLKQRGYSAWKAGTMTTTAFAKALAQEWASLPVLISTVGAHRQVGAGQSYYAGDGLNKALVTDKAFSDALLAALHATA